MLRRASLIVLCGLAVLLVAHSNASGAVDLQYKFTPGEVVRHKMVVDVDAVLAADAPNVPQLPPFHMKLVGIIKQKTTRILPNGDAEVMDTVESMTGTAVIGNQTKKIPVDKIPPMTGIMSKYGPTNPIGFAGKGGNNVLSNLPLGNSGLTQFIQLPGQALNPGDYWTDTTNLPLGIRLEQKSTLAAENSKLGSYNVAVVKQELSGSMDVPFQQLMALAAQIGKTNSQMPQVDGALQALMIGGSTTYFSVRKGRVVRSEGTIDMQMDANVNDGQTAGRFTIRARVNYTVNLVPPK